MLFRSAQALSSCCESGLRSSCAARASHCGAQALGAQASNSCGSRTLEHGLQELWSTSGVARGCCSATCGIFLDQGTRVQVICNVESGIPVSEHFVLCCIKPTCLSQTLTGSFVTSHLHNSGNLSVCPFSMYHFLLWDSVYRRFYFLPEERNSVYTSPILKTRDMDKCV